MNFKNKWRVSQSVFLVFFLVIIFLTFPILVKAGTIKTSSVDGLVGYWTMDGGDINWTTNQIIDRSGSGNTGSLVNLSSYTSPSVGKIGQALDFDGVNDYVNVPDNASLDLTGSFTLSLWVKTNNSGSDALITKLTLSPYDGWAFRIESNGRLGVYLKNWVFGTTVVADQTWHYVAFVYNGDGTGQFYVDGVADGGLVSGLTTPTNTLQNLYIGRQSWNPSVYTMNGLIDDVRIYNRALSTTEIQNIYTTSGLSKISASAPTVTTSNPTGLNRGLVGYWTMDGGDINWTTNQIIDRSGNGNTGTLTNLSSLTSPAIGKIGQGLDFDGLNDYVVTSNLVNNFSDETVTISVWFKANSAGVIVDELGQATPNINWHDSQIEILSTGEVKVRVWSLSTVSLGSVNFGEWHHVILRYNKATSNLDGFLDGVESVLDVSGNRSAPWESGYGMYYAFGQSDTTKIGTGNFFSGLIDDMRIYNRALSNVEVQELYNLGSAKISASAPTVTSSNPTGLNRGLVGYWTMDGGDINWTTNQIIDRSGSGNTGSLTNLSSLTSPAIGKIGQALKFSRGTGSLQKIDSTFIIPGVTSKLTLSAWVKPASYPSERFTIIQDYYYLSLASDGSLQSYWYDTSSPGYHSSGANTVPLNKWSYVVSVWDGSYVRLYVDGVLKKTTAVTGNGRNLRPPFIGAATTVRQFDGLIDDVRIYNRALSTTEIQQLYNIGK